MVNVDKVKVVLPEGPLLKGIVNLKFTVRWNMLGLGQRQVNTGYSSRAKVISNVNSLNASACTNIQDLLGVSDRHVKKLALFKNKEHLIYYVINLVLYPIVKLLKGRVSAVIQDYVEMGHINNHHD